MQAHTSIQTGLAWRRVFHSLLIALALAATARSQAQTDSFDAGNDSNWRHFDLNALVPNNATYTFPADGAGGKAYRVKTTAVPAEYVGQLGPARALCYRPDVTYAGRFTLGLDVIAWNNGVDQAFGPFWFTQNGIGVRLHPFDAGFFLGQLRGY